MNNLNEDFLPEALNVDVQLVRLDTRQSLFVNFTFTLPNFTLQTTVYNSEDGYN